MVPQMANIQKFVINNQRTLKNLELLHHAHHCCYDGGISSDRQFDHGSNAQFA